MRVVPALKVHQWLSAWDNAGFDEASRRRKPEPHFYLLSLAASELRALSGIQRRSADELKSRADDTGIQRRLDPKRAQEIRRYLNFGYPLSDVKGRHDTSEQYRHLLKPGWLPTAVVVNILRPDDERLGMKVHPSDLIYVADGPGGTASISLPNSFDGPDWRPKQMVPVEVIDGQHRLWAFDADNDAEGYELPVVAFYGLDISWQAYLFWTINIKPKRINASLAYDLYPLLRTEDWLNQAEGLLVYRENRAQELTEWMWSHPQSPWRGRINMLGESGGDKVTQASWIRALTATVLKARGSGPDGALFASPLGRAEQPLGWTRVQQAAFLIVFWGAIEAAVRSCDFEWARALRVEGSDRDLAFAGPNSLLNTDQGIRGVLHVINDLCCRIPDELYLFDWAAEPEDGANDEEAVTRAITGLMKHPVKEFLVDVADQLAVFDWRTSSAPGVKGPIKDLKSAFRGSSGYRILRNHLLRHLCQLNSSEVAAAASAVLGDQERGA